MRILLAESCHGVAAVKEFGLGPKGAERGLCWRLMCGSMHIAKLHITKHA